MAKLHNTQYITLDPAVWRGREDETITVGNNRTVRFDDHAVSGNPVLRCFLHGIGVVTFHAEQADFIEITLQHYGWRTKTTASAMQDFLRAMGYAASVSMAGGEMSVRVRGREGWVEKTEDRYGEILLLMRAPAYTAA